MIPRSFSSFFLTSQRLDDAIATRERNGLDALRLFAATMVVFRHAYGLPAGADPNAEPVLRALGFISAGGLGVATLFFLSGLLISQSWARTATPVEFAAHRVARIWPGLIWCLVLTAYFIVPIGTDAAASYYLRPDVHHYVTSNALLYRMQFEISGVFGGHRFGAINGSLWTLPPEVTMYCVVLALGLCGLLRNGWIAAICAVIVGVLLWRIPAIANTLHLGWELVRGMLFFLGGMGAHSLRRQVRIAPWHAMAAWVVFALTPASAKEPVFYLVWMVTLLALGTQLRLARLLRLRSDYSYGVYLYGFPIQQTLVHWMPASGAALNFVLAMPVCLAFAALSWHGVERPMLRWVRRLGPAAGAVATRLRWLHSLRALAFAVVLPGAVVLLAALAFVLTA